MPRRRLLLALGAAAAGGAVAAPPPRGAPVLRSTLAALPPLLMPAEAGRVRGIYADFLYALADEVGMELRLQVGPLGRAARDLSLGESDVTVLLPNDGLGPDVQSLGDVVPLHLMLQPRPGLPPVDLARLDQLRLIAYAGAGRWGALPAEQMRRVSYVTSPCSLMGMLKAGRADAALIVREANGHIMKSCGLDPASFPAALPLQVRHTQLWARAGLDPELAHRLRRAREALVARGLPAQLLKRYELD